MLLLGAPENYPYTNLSVISDIQPGAKDEGLIMRFVFGKNEAIKNSNIGDFMAYQTVSMFLRNTTDRDVLADILDPESDGDYEFMNLSNAYSELDKRLTYLPLAGLIVGLYLIYSIFKIAIEIGIRMFKMLILQILAPIAIITCIDGGLKSKTFTTYYKTFLGVFVQVFIRVFVMYVITVFVCKFFIALPDFFHELQTGAGSGFKKSLVAIIIIIAGYKMVNDIPKFIDEALGTKIAGADNSKGGFGKFVGGLLGAGIGLASGVAIGAATGGLGGALTGGVGSMIGGYKSGSKGNNVAEWFKGQGANMKSSVETGLRNKDNKGKGFWGSALGYGLGQATGMTALHNSRIEKGSKPIQDAIDDATEANNKLDQMEQIGRDAIADMNSSYIGSNGAIKFGDSDYEDAAARSTQEYKDASEAILIAETNLELLKKEEANIPSSTYQTELLEHKRKLEEAKAEQGRVLAQQKAKAKAEYQAALDREIGSSQRDRDKQRAENRKTIAKKQEELKTFNKNHKPIK